MLEGAPLWDSIPERVWPTEAAPDNCAEIIAYRAQGHGLFASINEFMFRETWRFKQALYPNFDQLQHEEYFLNNPTLGTGVASNLNDLFAPYYHISSQIAEVETFIETDMIISFPEGMEELEENVMFAQETNAEAAEGLAVFFTEERIRLTREAEVFQKEGIVPCIDLIMQEISAENPDRFNPESKDPFTLKQVEILRRGRERFLQLHNTVSYMSA